MVFGADKIPEIARGLGKGIRQVKDATNDIKKEIKDSSEKNGIDTDITNDLNKGISDDFKRVKKEMSKVKDNIDDLTGPIKRNF